MLEAPVLLPDLLVKTAPLLGLHPRLEGEGSRGAAVLLQMGQGCLFFWGVGGGSWGTGEMSHLWLPFSVC